MKEIEYRPPKDNSFHLAGIIPVSGQDVTDFNMDWHSSLMPIAPDYTAIEHAITECSYAGCETIWLVVDDSITPLVRHRIGEWVYDKVYMRRKNKYPREARVRIPIHYVPTDPMDKDRRDSLSWSVINGAYIASRVSSEISRWTIPDRFYVSFPYGIFDPKELREHRLDISSKNPFFLSHNGKTVKDGEFLSFTMTYQDFKMCRMDVKEKEDCYYDTSQPKEEWRMGRYPTKPLPLEDRYTARWFGPDQVFNRVAEKNKKVVELEWYNDISTWEKYREFMASENIVKRPWGELLKKGREWNPMGKDKEDIEESTYYVEDY